VSRHYTELVSNMKELTRVGIRMTVKKKRPLRDSTDGIDQWEISCNKKASSKIALKRRGRFKKREKTMSTTGKKARKGGTRCRRFVLRPLKKKIPQGSRGGRGKRGGNQLLFSSDKDRLKSNTKQKKKTPLQKKNWAHRPYHGR